MRITRGLGEWVNHNFTLCRFTWPFPFGVCLSWLTASARNPAPADSVGHAFLLRGQGAVFSPGFGRLCTNLRQRDWRADDLRCVGDLRASRQLRTERERTQHKAILFVGHSCGGRYAIWAAWRLFRLGITVDMIVCVDVAFPPPIPPNVLRAVHIYKSGLRLYPARPLRVRRCFDDYREH